MKGIKTIWTVEMIEKLKVEFPIRFSRDIGKEMGVSIRTIIRKARELGLEKEEAFLDKRRNDITKLASKSKPPNPFKGKKGWSVPGGEVHRFKKGMDPMKKDYVKIHLKRNETIRKEKLRLKYDLPQKTKLNIKNF